MLDAIISNYNSPAEFDYSFHVALEPRFVYVSNPKVGCSTAKATLNRALARAQGRSLDYSSIGDIHDRGYNPLLKPSEVGPDRFRALLADPEVPKFAFLRDSLSRVASAWSSKLSWEGPFLARVRSDLARRDPAFAEGDLTPARFIEAISRWPEVRDMDEHWRLQRRQTSADRLPGLTLFSMEDFSTTLTQIVQDLFRDPQAGVFDVPKWKSENRSSSAAVLAGLGDGDRARVAAAYAEDAPLLAAARPAFTGWHATQPS